MPKITKLKVVIFIFWIAFFIAVYLSSRTRQPVQLDFDLQVRASQKMENQGKFYFDTGYGYNEEDVLTVNYDPQTSGQLQHYQLIIPEKIQDIESVRFTPLSSVGEIVIKNIRLSKLEMSQELTLETSDGNISGEQQLKKVVFMGNQFYVVTKGDKAEVELNGSFSYPFFKELKQEIAQQDSLQLLAVAILGIFLAIVLTIYSTNLKKGERPRIP